MSENDVKSICIDQSDLELLKSIKTRLVKSQLYDEAAKVRDLEKRLTELITDLIGMGYVLPSLKGEEQEKIFSRHDVRKLIDLTNKPLKEALQRYEDSMKLLIEQHVAGLMGTIHDQQDLAKEEAIAFGTFILNQFTSSPLFNSKQIYEDWQADKVKKAREAQIASNLRMNDPQTMMNQIVTRDPSGQWVSAKPIEMVCEHEGCANIHGREYKRPETGDSWDGEPIFLCDKHSVGHEPFST